MLEAKRKALVCSLCIEKSLTVSLLAKELLAIISFLPNRLKPFITCAPADTHTHMRSRDHSCMDVHTYAHLLRVHACTLANVRKRKHTGASARTRTQAHAHAREIHAHVRNCTCSSANARIHAQTYTNQFV